MRRMNAYIFGFSVLASLFLNQLFVWLDIASLSRTYMQVEQQQFGTAFLLGLLVYGIAAPVVEELIFRYLLQRECYRLFQPDRRGRYLLVILLAILFGAYHGNVVQGLYAFPMGVLLGLFYELTGMLATPILFHVGANLTCWLVSNLIGFPTGLVGGISCLIWGLLSAIAGCFIFRTLFRVREIKENCK